MGNKVNILYIDDEEINRMHFDLIFSRWYDVFLAEDLEQTFNCLKKHNIDIIFSDQKLANSFGTDLLNDIHKDNKDIPKYIITGFLESERIEQSLESGIVKKVIHKPYHFEELKEIIDSYKL